MLFLTKANSKVGGKRERKKKDIIMGETLGKLFVPLTALPDLYNNSAYPVCVESDGDYAPGECVVSDPSFFGVVQLLFLGGIYGLVLFKASNLIADGSELLLLIPSIAPIVGSVVLPILGAVPDGAIVLFSGMGPIKEVQEQIAVGVGALAGSTIMLITVPWFLSIYAGRVSIENGEANYKKPRGAGEDWKKIAPGSSWLSTGVSPNRAAMVSGAKTMAITSISYLIIQGAAFSLQTWKKPKSVLPDPTIAKDERYYALTGLLLCVLLFVAYLIQQVLGSRKDAVLADVVDRKREEAIANGTISLRMAFHGLLAQNGADDEETLIPGSEKATKKFRNVVARFFRKIDTSGDGSLDKAEVAGLMQKMHVKEDPETMFKAMDRDSSGSVDFDEFVAYLESVMRGESEASNSPATSSRRMSSLKNAVSKYGATSTSGTINEGMEMGMGSAAEDEEEEEEEEEEIPEDLADLPPDVQRRRIIMRSLYMMGLGTVLVLLFSDPMVDVMSNLGTVMNLKPFYISFVLAPLASNASELIASYNYALKKTSKTITISLTALEGAAIMNNTFCLGIFLALVYFRQLEWEFAAETISILFVQLCIMFVAVKEVQTVKHGLFVVALFPLSIVLVAVLEGLGLD